MKTKYLFCIVLILSSCYKDAPEPGYYFIHTEFSGQPSYNTFAQIVISETTKDHIIIEGSKLKKKGKKVSGTFVLEGYDLTIDGVLNKGPDKGLYSIEGTCVLNVSGSAIEGNFNISDF